MYYRSILLNKTGMTNVMLNLRDHSAMFFLRQRKNMAKQPLVKSALRFRFASMTATEIIAKFKLNVTYCVELNYTTGLL